MYKHIDDKAFEAGLKAIENSLGKDFAEKGLKTDNYKAIPTGHDDLDAMLTRNANGIYLGGICEIFGNEGGGKSSLAMRTVHMAQKLGLHCMWVDAEHGFSPDLAEINGIDISKLIMLNMTVGEGEDLRLLNAAEVLDRVYRIVWNPHN